MSNAPRKFSDSALFTIGVFSKLTGISPGTLRIWERRYQIATPARTGPREKRMYSKSDLDRLALVKALVDQGHPVSTLAHLSIDELRERLSVTVEKTVPASGQNQPLTRVIVLGESLAIRFKEHIGSLNGVEVRGSFRTASEFDDQVAALMAEVLVIEYATLQRDTPADIARQLLRSGARHVIVVYGVGARATLRELENSGVLCLKAPVSPTEIADACARLRGAPRSKVGDSFGKANGIPPRRFLPDQLARIASRSTPMKCECPHHLVDLVNSLVAFETYSSECENLYPEDLEIHRMLHSTTAAARALMEEGLAKVIEAEGIAID